MIPLIAQSRQRRNRNPRRRRRAAITLPLLHSRIAIDPPIGAKVAIGTITDPFGLPESAPKQQKRRADGSISPGEGEWVSPGQPKIVVLRSIRTDPLGWAHSHDHIGEAEYLAGRHWQNLYERSHIGGVQAVDISKEPVDGGKIPEVLTDGQRLALIALRRAQARLETSVPGDKGRGVARVRLVYEVLGEGKFMRQVAAERGTSARSAITALSREFRRALTVLATEFGLISGQKEARTRIRGWRTDDKTAEK